MVEVLDRPRDLPCSGPARGYGWRGCPTAQQLHACCSAPSTRSSAVPCCSGQRVPLPGPTCREASPGVERSLVGVRWQQRGSGAGLWASGAVLCCQDQLPALRRECKRLPRLLSQVCINNSSTSVLRPLALVVEPKGAFTLSCVSALPVSTLVSCFH